ncbi:MAG TPA: TonB-dependent receptor [Pyrinomonadaceae bacterium]|nr:TonB-dependent receptor [Pyrinomonadaceae bacterium]
MLGHRFMARALVVCLAAVVLFAPVRVPAQSKGDASLKVTVFDAQGAFVRKARVTLKAAAGVEKTAETNDRGEASLSRLPAGRSLLLVEAEGFEPYVAEALELAAGFNQTEVRLEVAAVREEVEVAPDARERNLDPRGPAFSNVLTEEHIASLPDDPDEFEAAVNQLAGPGANIRINGFRGGKLPPKSQIREIRFRRNAYAAENHERGFITVDIFTKPGIGDWHGSAGFGFRDESLNARQAFAPFRGAEQFRRFDFTLEGPIWKNRTSLFLAADGNSAYDSKTIVAATEAGRLDDLVVRPSRRLNFSARAEHSFNKLHALRAEYQRNTGRQENLGVGDFDLPERAYTFEQTEHIFRLSQSGTFAKRYLNDLRFQARWQGRDTTAATDAPTILVAGAFNAGGALTRGSRRSREIELSDDLDFAAESHSMRAGLRFEAGSYRGDERSNPFGTYTFASLDAYRQRLPTTYTERTGDPSLSFSQYQFAWYWQDDWRVRKNLLLSYGVRHEMQTNLGDRANFAPRVGLVWTPTKSGNITIRAGGGVFYDWFESNNYEQTLRVDGVRQRDLVVRSPLFGDPFGGGAGIALPPGKVQVAPDLEMPTVLMSSVGLDLRPSKWFRLGADYRFERGLHLLRGRNINAPFAGLGRPDPSLGNVTQIESSASSTSNRLMLHLSPAMIKIGFFWSAMYMYSRTMTDTAGALSLPSNNFDLRGEWGPSAGDMRHYFSAMINRRVLFKGLSVGATFSASSATPYNVTTGFDDNGDTVSNDRPDGVGRNSARGAGRWDISTRVSYGFGFGGPRKSSAATGPMVIRIGGDGGGPSLPGDGDQKFRIDLYAQFFNVLNHTNLTNFSGVQTSPFFGRATAALPGRRIESGLRFSF